MKYTPHTLVNLQSIIRVVVTYFNKVKKNKNHTCHITFLKKMGREFCDCGAMAIVRIVSDDMDIVYCGDKYKRHIGYVFESLEEGCITEEWIKYGFAISFHCSDSYGQLRTFSCINTSGMPLELFREFLRTPSYLRLDRPGGHAARRGKFRRFMKRKLADRSEDPWQYQ